MNTHILWNNLPDKVRYVFNAKNFFLLRKFCYAVNKEKVFDFKHKNMLASNQKSRVFISGQNMWSK